MPSKVRVMSNAPSPYFQLRSRNGIITWPSGMNSPLNQAMRLFESPDMAILRGLLLRERSPIALAWSMVGPGCRV